LQEKILYSVRHLFQVGYHGLSDLVPAIRQAFNADPTDDRLNLVYGSSPRANIVGVSVLAIGAGALFGRIGRDLPISPYIHWPAVMVGLIFALLLRRYLFYSGNARDGVHEPDFPWLAASLAAPLGLLMVESVVSKIAAPATSESAGDASPLFIGELVVVATHALGVAAAMTISVATLCFSRNWIRALLNLAVRLLVFRVMVFVTTLIMLHIGIVGPIVAAILRGIFHFSLPEWMTDLADQLSYAGLMSVIYLAVIGATWTVCRQSFGELLRSGDVDILRTIEALAVDPKSKRRRQEKKQKKAEKQARKANRGTRN
jgi:hypothetical protein